MKAVFTAVALTDLEDIIAYTKQKFPRSEEPLKHRIRAVISSIEQWPEGGRLIPNRAGVRTVPLIRYPSFLRDRGWRDSHPAHTSRRAR